jgi:hypothetical protein
MEKLGDLMTAVSFAEEGQHDTARQIMAGGSADSRQVYEKKLAGFVERCSRENILARVQKTELDAVSGIRSFLKNNAGIDKVVLSPAITETGNVTAKDLNRLVRTASRPIVTMTKQACAVA